MNRKAGEDTGSSFCHGQGWTYFFVILCLLFHFHLTQVFLSEKAGGNQIFEYSKSHTLIGGGNCLDTNGVNGVVKLKACEKSARNQQWDYDIKVKF